MRCFAECSEAKYGRAKCNERAAYTVVMCPEWSFAERERNVVGAKRRSHFFYPYYSFAERFFII